MPGDGLHPFRRDAPAPENVGQKRPDVGKAFGSAKRDDEQRIERATHYDTPNLRRITSPRYQKIFLNVGPMKRRFASRPRRPNGGA
jgi:hypothetical protein